MNVLVVGMEKTGLASVEFLVAQGHNVTATDMRALADMPAAAALLDRLQVPFPPQSSAPFTTSDLVPTPPGGPHHLEPLHHPRAPGVRVIGHLALPPPYLTCTT